MVILAPSSPALVFYFLLLMLRRETNISLHLKIICLCECNIQKHLSLPSVSKEEIIHRSWSKDFCISIDVWDETSQRFSFPSSINQSSHLSSTLWRGPAPVWETLNVSFPHLTRTYSEFLHISATLHRVYCLVKNTHIYISAYCSGGRVTDEINKPVKLQQTNLAKQSSLKKKNSLKGFHSAQTSTSLKAEIFSLSSRTDF